MPKNGPAEPGDFIATDVKFFDDEELLSELEEEVICLRPQLSFNDGNIEDFEQAMTGVCANETRDLKVKMSDEAPNEKLRGKEVRAAFHVLEVRKLELPELTPAFLGELGDFEDEQQLREAVRENITRQGEFDRYRAAREQITELLTKSANWDLPQELLNRQARRELERTVLELRRNGYSEADIRAYENDLRQNSRTATARSLREHFILERLAEEQGIEETPEDTEMEITLIARQLGDSPRRVRARLEKQGQMDALRNQIIERKTVQVILEQAKFTETPSKPRAAHLEAVNHAIGGKQREAIPEAHSATSGEAEEKHPSPKHA